MVESISELLFYGGIAALIFAVIGGIAAGIILRLARKRLNLKLEAEYGKKRR